MDIMLERIIELIGTKRGAKKELAEYLGISQNVFTSWFAMKSESYKKHAPKIADYYGVSLDWLSGKTDIKKDAASNNTDDTELNEFETIFNQLSPAGQEDLMWLARSLLERDHKK